MSSLAFYRIGTFTFLFSNHDFSDTLFDVFDFESSIKNTGNEMDVILSSDVCTARKRFNLKTSIKRDDIKRWFEESVNDNNYVNFYFGYDLSNEQFNCYFDKIYSKEFNFSNYFSSLKELFNFAYKNDFMKFCNDSFINKNAFIKRFRSKSFLNELLVRSFKSYANGESEDFFLLNYKKEPRYLIKLLLSILDDNCVIEYDMTEVFESEGYDYNSIKIRDYSSKTLVITEGTTDSNFLSPIIEYLYPCYSNCFAFMPLDKLDSGCSYLVKYLKLFTIANLKNNVLFIFDNDGAGNIAFNSLNYKFNEYIKAIKLNEREEFKKYPSISFDGSIVPADINGKAVSIELYFPDFCLKNKNHLSPVRWLSFEKKIRCYHGVIESKEIVQKNIKKFLRNIKIPPSSKNFNKLKSLISFMVDQFDYF